MRANNFALTLVINQPDAQNLVFTISLLHASTCFEHYVLIILLRYAVSKTSKLRIIFFPQIANLINLKNHSWFSISQQLPKYN